MERALSRAQCQDPSRPIKPGLVSDQNSDDWMSGAVALPANVDQENSLKLQ
jgi:hypothetical protein